MAETYSVLVPDITSATFSVNPVSMNGMTVLTINVVEKTVVLEPDKIYSGEFYSGEV